MAEITLLDGGMGQELVKRSGDTPTPLWASQVMIDNPGLVAAIHRDFVAAGASVATTNTYAIHHDRFADTPFEGRLAELIDLALSEAANGTNGQGRIAGAIGPLGASYRPYNHPDYPVAKALYREIADQLAPSVDLILGETVASVAHGRSLLDAAKEMAKPVWLSVTLDDGDGRRLRSGEPLEDLRELQPDAWLANCSVPEVMAAGLDILGTFGKPFGAYANGFTEISTDFLRTGATVEALSARTDIGPKAYADFAIGWVGQGATIIGGCCEIGPAHIAKLALRLRADGHDLV